MRVRPGARQALLDKLSVLAEHDPRFADLVGIEVGGSVGRCDGDRLSDVDIFVYVEDADLRDYLEVRMWQLCDELGAYRQRRGPSFLPMLGWGFTVDYEDAGFVQLFVRPRSEMGPTYLQAQGAAVEYDPDGSLARVLAAANDTAVPTQILAHESVVMIYFRAYGVAKEVVRGNDWQARKYFREMLENVLVLTRLVYDVEPRGRYYRHSGRGMEQDLPAEVATRIRGLELAGTADLTPAVLDSALALCAELDDGRVDWTVLRTDIADVFIDCASSG